MISNGRNQRFGPGRSATTRDNREPWAQIYEGVIAYVLKHRQEYGADLVRNPLISEGIASILRGLEVLLDGNIGDLDDARCWSNLDSLARFAGWEGGLEDAEGGLIEAWLAPVKGDGPIAGNGHRGWIEEEESLPVSSRQLDDRRAPPESERNAGNAHDPAATAPQRRIRRQDWA
jgi:hypothetical protein